MAFYSYIPPYGYENNSPIFTDNPVPFICSGDTTTFLNTAIDPDGDELIFSFMAPLDGNHAGGWGGANNIGNGGAGPGGSLNWYPQYLSLAYRRSNLCWWLFLSTTIWTHWILLHICVKRS